MLSLQPGLMTEQDMLPSVLEGDYHATGTAAEDEYADVTGHFSSTAGMISLCSTMDLSSTAPQDAVMDDDVSSYCLQMPRSSA